jgi:CTP synthase
VKVVLDWIDSTEFEKDKKQLLRLKRYAGVLIPGGFGSRGVEGKIRAVQFCREQSIPYFGLCYGMQLAVIEYARNILGLTDALTTEIDQKTTHPVVDIMPEQKENLRQKNYGATMRLGHYEAKILPKTIAREAYGKASVFERHRHRYEVNPAYVKDLEKSGLIFSATSPDGILMEIAELPKVKHPFFLGTQFHPEFQSSLLHPHPLFVAFVKASSERKK